MARLYGCLEGRLSDVQNSDAMSLRHPGVAVLCPPVGCFLLNNQLGKVSWSVTNTFYRSFLTEQIMLRTRMLGTHVILVHANNNNMLGCFDVFIIPF